MEIQGVALVGYWKMLVLRELGGQVNVGDLNAVRLFP
jgi:hypothetical protein